MSRPPSYLARILRQLAGRGYTSRELQGFEEPEEPLAMGYIVPPPPPPTVKHTCGACGGVGKIIPEYNREAVRVCSICKGSGVIKLPLESPSVGIK